MKNLLLVLLTSITIVNCSRNQYNKYLGYWELENSKKPNVLHLYKDGEAYILLKNIYSVDRKEGFMRMKADKPIVLKKSEGQLMLGFIILGIIDDSKKLIFSNRVYNRIDDAQLNELNAKIKIEKEESELRKKLYKKNEKYCNEYVNKKLDLGSKFKRNQSNLEFRQNLLEIATKNKSKQGQKDHIKNIKEISIEIENNKKELKQFENDYKDIMSSCDMNYINFMTSGEM